jgi:DNA polymerase-4
VKFNSFEITTRNRSVPVAVKSREGLEQPAVALLHEMPVPRPVRLLGVSLSSLQGNDRDEPQFGLPIIQVVNECPAFRCGRERRIKHF